MSENEALQQARELLNTLVEAANTGAIVPVRLPAQLEAVSQLLAQAADSDDGDGAGAAESGDVEAIKQDNAQFMSTAIHELRTPMTSIRGYADMLNSPSMGELTEMQQQFLDVIRTNAKRMEGLLTDVSDISKIRGGTLKINVKMDMFKNIAMMVEKAAQPVAEELGRQVTFDIPQGLPILNTDGELLAKALFKLVENGLRYNTREDGHVTLSAQGEDNTLLIEIRDNGIGMADEELAQLGTIYFRAENDVVRQYKGSGLGIPIAMGIIELLGGQMTIHSKQDEGTTIHIAMPGMS
ncbi:MAG: sensor histidine kinase [Chloroflexi bacterium]|nr:MAG: sensor histidine kinase [Chloroflexota bacterium]